MNLLEEPMHPGEVLKELYLDPLDMGVIAFARRLGVPRTRIERLVKGVTGMTPDTALRLARAFNTTPAYWMNMQTNYDMAAAFKEVDVSGIEPLVEVFDHAESVPQTSGRVVIDPSICAGRPHIRNTRVRVFRHPATHGVRCVLRGNS